MDGFTRRDGHWFCDRCGGDVGVARTSPAEHVCPGPPTTNYGQRAAAAANRLTAAVKSPSADDE